MLFKIVSLAVIGVFAYTFPGFDSEHAVLLAALPVAAAVTFLMLGSG